MRIFLISLILILTFQQEKKDKQEATEIYQAVLCGGDSMIFGNKTLKFKEVISDSRCPVDVTCVWAGELRILAEVYEGNKKVESFELVSNTPFKFNYGDYLNMQFNMMSVSPAPKVNRKLTLKDYRINFKITEKKSS